MTKGILKAAEVGVYEPHPRIYLEAAERLGVPPASVTLVAGHGWDVMGAASAGLGAICVDRSEKVWPFPFDPPARADDLDEAVERLLREGRPDS